MTYQNLSYIFLFQMILVFFFFSIIRIQRGGGILFGTVNVTQILDTKHAITLMIFEPFFFNKFIILLFDDGNIEIRKLSHMTSNSKEVISSADLEVQLVQLNHCDGVYSNYWNTLLRNLNLSPYINFYV